MIKLGGNHLEDSLLDLVTNAAIGTNLWTVTYGVLSILYEKYSTAKVLRRRAKEAHRRAIARHVRKLWKKAVGYAFTQVYLRDPTIRPMPLHVMLELSRRARLKKLLADLRDQLYRTEGAMSPRTNPQNDHPYPKEEIETHVQVDSLIDEQ